MGGLAGNQNHMVSGEHCHVLVKLSAPPPAVHTDNNTFMSSFSSCGEDMEASDGEGVDEVLPPSKVII